MDETLLEDVSTAHVQFNRALAEFAAFDPDDASPWPLRQVNTASPLNGGHIAVDDPQLSSGWSLRQVDLPQSG